MIYGGCGGVNGSGFAARALYSYCYAKRKAEEAIHRIGMDAVRPIAG